MCPGTGHSQFGHFSPNTVQSRTVIYAATSRSSSFQKYSSHSFYQFSVRPTSKEKQSSKCSVVVKLVNYFSIFVDCFQFWTLNRIFLYVNEKLSFQNALQCVLRTPLQKWKPFVAICLFILVLSVLLTEPMKKIKAQIFKSKKSISICAANSSSKIFWNIFLSKFFV